MAQKYSKLLPKHRQFIAQQQMFFVATAESEGRVNVSPKGLDSLRILDDNRILWLNLTGSGNETAAHVQKSARMTLMFNAFTGPPLILRVYGQAESVHKNDKNWQELYEQFDDYIGARQMFVLNIDLVQTSCGMAVPLYDYKQQRQQLLDSAKRKGTEKIKEYWAEKNQFSLDGKETHIVSKNIS